MKTNFMGMELTSPIIVASSPATETWNSIIKCKENGVGAVILKTAANYDRADSYQQRRWYRGENGVWAQSSFDREIFMLLEVCELIRKLKETVSFPIIASVTHNSWDSYAWIEAIQKIEEAGADMIQLDLFYISQSTDISKDEIKEFLKGILEKSKVPIIPKLNINFSAMNICKIIKESGIKGVSLLDSVRVPPPVLIGEDGNLKYPDNISAFGASYFGQWQLPLTESYLHQAVKNGLEVCAGGGIGSSNDGIQLLMRGAKTIQVATGILKYGFPWLKNLNDDIEKFLESNGLSLEELYEKSKEVVMKEFNDMTV